MDKNPTMLIDCSTIAAYIKLASFKITNEAVIKKLYTLKNVDERSFSVQTIQDAAGTVVNMDFFAVTIKQLPNLKGTPATPEQFLNYFRTHINDFSGGTKFNPYDNLRNINDTELWNSSDPTGAMVHIFIPGPAGLWDNGTVITAESQPDHWIFSTVKSPMDGEHPVSGNRRFGIYKQQNGTYLIYVKGVDRITDRLTNLLQKTTGLPLNSADALWEGFQKKVNEFINTNGGSSEIMPPLKARPNWDLVKKVLNGQESIETLKKNGGCE
ncbi:hypothetical protein HF329_21240 [Chitinophaga oryzae]|uniref:Uncharacterized protein n=1 Tax=Chitinophaga oryzae TaxID=2725414 RepID=A0AAE6ZJC6_9BACT|nr:hypothetical protein [Chitinophaga oryzae]QJB33702.1 hypothetical protein HF329_21240 [Chitinophaga oryzae]